VPVDRIDTTHVEWDCEGGGHVYLIQGYSEVPVRFALAPRAFDYECRNH
jgi:hypothetical protein